MNAYNEELEKCRRFLILELLGVAADYSLHEHHIKAGLRDKLMGSGTDALRASLQWLGDQGLVYLKQPGGVWLATLTARGDDVLTGLTANPGVSRPRPD